MAKDADMIVVYSALFGNYEKPMTAPFGGTLFTDPGQPSADGWKVTPIEPRPHPDPRYASRYCFDQSTRVLPHAEYTIMHGANGQLLMDPTELVSYLPTGIDIGCWRHAHRSNVYEEAQACIRLRKDNKDVVTAQMERYLDEGFPGDGLSTAIILVRRNTPDVAEFEAFWWNEVLNGSCRDQLSFDYTRWRTGIPVHYFDIPRNYVLKVRRHVSAT